MEGVSARRATATLVALFVASFVVGSAELVVVGIVDLISGALHVSTATGGLLVTAYALGISIGGPALTAATMRCGRRRVLQAALAAYLVGTVVAATADDFGLLLAARALTGSLHGLFIGVAFAVAAAVVPPERMGRAISVVFGGIAVSTALGVPLGTLLGQHLGWRASFAAVVALGVVALVATLAAVPAVPASRVGGLRAQARHALAPRVLAVLGLGLLVMGGQFAALTYITSYLQSVAGISTGLTAAFLLAYGLANAVGTFAGGWAADRSATRTLPLAILALVAAFTLLLAAGTVAWAVALAMVLWGVVGFGLVPALQYRVVRLAGPGRDLASTLPSSAVTMGIAIGSLAGGSALTAHGSSGPVVVALVTTAVALPISWATGRLRVPADGAAAVGRPAVAAAA